MRAVHVVLAALCVVLSVALSGHTLPSLLLPAPSTPTEHKFAQEMLTPSKHALVVGASSGIGLGVAKELAPIVAKLTLCSRSYPEELLKTIKADNPNVEVVHEKLDVSLMHEVRKFTTKHATTQFDWIVMSPGIMTIRGRTETSEGLDVKMATHYYGRYSQQRAAWCVLLHALTVTLLL
jgi:NAD(P)-dependent dehydrogenase (short-subunit alcohol dehydrogenase family)